jgi:hypothetical protein
VTDEFDMDSWNRGAANMAEMRKRYRLGQRVVVACEVCVVVTMDGAENEITVQFDDGSRRVCKPSQVATMGKGGAA